MTFAKVACQYEDNMATLANTSEACFENPKTTWKNQVEPEATPALGLSTSYKMIEGFLYLNSEK